MTFPRPALHGGNPWALLEPSAEDPSAILDFSVDVNPLGPPPALERLLAEAAPRAAWYPEPTYREFREAAAQSEGVNSKNVLPGNGTADLIHLITRFRKGAPVAVVTPTFTEYERAAVTDGSAVFSWGALPEEAGFLPWVPERFGREMEGGVIFLCNPNNPTGVLWVKERLLDLIDRAEKTGILVVVDEAYMDFVDEHGRYSLAQLAAQSRGLLVLRSLTKAFCIPGLRSGYLVGSEQLVEQLQAIQPPWAMNAIAAFVGSRLFSEREWLDAASQQAGIWRSSLWNELRTFRGIKPNGSAANFFLCRLLEASTSESRWAHRPANLKLGPARQLAAKLASRGILVRVCDDFTGLQPDRYIRIAVRNAEENARLVKALREIENAG